MGDSSHIFKVHLVETYFKLWNLLKKNVFKNKSCSFSYGESIDKLFKEYNINLGFASYYTFLVKKKNWFCKN